MWWILLACATPDTDTDTGAAPADPVTTPDPCNLQDDDGDGLVDEDEPPSTWYVDQDRDGHGDPASPLAACSQPSDAVASADDCGPYDPGRFPGAAETCDGADEDCDGAVDEEVDTGATWCADTDGDGFGDSATCVSACDPPAGWVATDTDCDDTRADVNPRAPEVCDDADTDEDCDGLADADDGWIAGGSAVWPDADGDGFGDTTADPLWVCAPRDGWVEDASDCDDTDPGRFPGAADPPDDRDTDCDGLARRANAPSSSTPTPA